uniref:RNase H type-1 domain-containing protein n=1 Tax=Brassica oleracea var. oleracea TaxID=109376 RepID=A0A0D3DK41_BRAOL
MHNPDSLLTKVLKGKYFPESSFLESGAKTGASHGWVSMMAGKAILEKGLGYLVGNGENIKVWTDSWLSPSKLEAPIGPPTLDNQNLLVADLLHPLSNEWDLEKIRLHLPHYEEKIRFLIPTVFSDWFSAQVHRVALPPLGIISSPLAPWLLWNLWTARNKLVFEGKAFLVEDIISKAVAEARAWEDANLGKKKESVKTGGMGWIIMNEEGAVLCRGSSNMIYVGSALIVEALAMRDALKQAKDLLLPSLHIYSDSQVLISTLCEGWDLNEIAGILTDIRNLATLFCPISYSFVPENSQADSLARASLARLIM